MHDRPNVNVNESLSVENILFLVLFVLTRVHYLTALSLSLPLARLYYTAASHGISPQVTRLWHFFSSSSSSSSLAFSQPLVYCLQDAVIASLEAIVASYVKKVSQFLGKC